MMRILLSEHRVSATISATSALPQTWETVLELVALIESWPDAEWTHRAPELRLLAAELVRETAAFPRPVPDAVQRFLDRCAAS